jgi:tetratricopeptide (TPR) repeat protein
VSAATGLAMPQLADYLDAATAVHVVVEGRAGGTAYGFAHALLRDAVLEGLTAPRRQLLHATVASVLAARRDAEGLARRAGHLLSAGPVAQPDEVRAACVDVARDAARRQEFSVAAHWWECALAVVPESHDRLELELEAVRALSRSGRPERAVERVATAFTCAVQARDIGSAARLAEELVHVQDGWTWTVFGEPRPPLLDHLLDALPLAEEPAHRVALLSAVTSGLHLFSRAEERLPHADEAQRLAEQSNDVELRRSAYGGALKALIQVPKELGRSWSLVDALRDCLDPVSDRLTVFESQTRADLLMLSGSVTRSRAVHERTIALSDSLRLPGFRAQERWSATRYAQWHGDFEAAEQLADRALQVHEQTGVQYAAGGYAQSLLSLRRLQGRAREVDARHLELTRGYNHELWQALRASESGDVKAGRRWLASVPRERLDWWGMLSNLVMLAHGCCDLGVVERAEQALEDLTPYTGLVAVFGHFGTVGPVDLALGRLLLLLERRDAAIERLEDARSLAAREEGLPFAEQAERMLALTTA